MRLSLSLDEIIVASYALANCASHHCVSDHGAIIVETILEDIQKAITAGAAYSALAALVTLPEICGRCEQIDVFSSSGQFTGANIYVRFIGKYLKGWSLGLTGEDLFNLRNGLSHRGRTDTKVSPLRYVFHPTNPRGCVSHGNRTYRDDELSRLDIDLQIFYNAIAKAVRLWAIDNKDNQTVQKNLNDILQVREGDFGTGIHIEGMIYLA